MTYNRDRLLTPLFMPKPQKGYTPEEAKILIHEYIDRSAVRLKKRLEEAWKKQKTVPKKEQYV